MNRNISGGDSSLRREPDNLREQDIRRVTVNGPAVLSPGSTTDVGLIYETFGARLRRFIAGRVPSGIEAEDILQNVFYNLSKIDLAANPIGQVSAWLYTAARNQIIDHSRKKREERMPQVRQGSDDGDFLTDLSDLLAGGDDLPDTLYLRSLVWEELDAALAELPPEQRTVFELTELAGVPFREISESTGIPVNTLTSRKRYAVLHLREALGELYRDLLGKE